MFKHLHFILTAIFFIYGCNNQSGSSPENNQNEISIKIEPEKKVDFFDTSGIGPNKSYELVTSKDEKDSWGTQIPFKIVKESLMTDEKFDRYWVVKIKNISKLTITNILIMMMQSYSDNKYFDLPETERNIPINVAPGRTGTFRVPFSPFHSVKYMKVRYSNGDAYEF